LSIKRLWRIYLSVFLIAAPVLCVAPLGAEEKAAERTWQHGASLFGELKYPANFTHFDYVNPPKAGRYASQDSALTIILIRWSLG
jgi:microcin C transport system substrate-binding protein